MVYVVDGACLLFVFALCFSSEGKKRTLHADVHPQCHTGRVVKRRSWLRLSAIPELFWFLANLVHFLCVRG
jgi:hypothetical protein